MRNSRVVLTISEENTANPELVFDFDQTKVAQAVCEKVLETEGCPYDAEISLTYTGDEEIRSINRDYREIDKVKDVLSFPNLPFEGAKGPGSWEDVCADAADCLDPESGNLVLGDIVLNLNRVALQAEEYGHSRKREFAFLIAHSMLHLCGYDHMTEADAEVMFGRQEAVLEALGITRQ